MNWYAIHTKPKQEESVSQRLLRKEIEVYNPLFQIKKYLRGNYRAVTEPLFPCYLFARFELAAHSWMITYTRGVRKIVGGKEGPWPVADAVIDFIRCREKDGVITVGPGELKGGDTLKIIDGPFAGLTGILDRPLKGSERVVVLLNALEYQARLIVDSSSLVRAC